MGFNIPFFVLSICIQARQFGEQQGAKRSTLCYDTILCISHRKLQECARLGLMIPSKKIYKARLMSWSDSNHENTETTMFGRFAGFVALCSPTGGLNEWLSLKVNRDIWVTLC